jgi:hypothetical protein
MAHLIVLPKSGSDWGTNELTFFSINIISQNSADFFGVDPLPHPNVPTAILETPTATAAAVAHDEVSLIFLSILEMAMTGVEEGDVDDFSQAVLRLMGYERFGCHARINKKLTFTMCGRDDCSAQTNVCLMDRNHILLIVQEDKRDFSTLPEGQLVAEAIAAFTHNNKRRVDLGQQPVAESNIAGIIMRSTFPVFYKIRVTQDLVKCVSLGQHLALPTSIFRHVPQLPDGPDMGMFTLANRRVALQCYEAFRAIVFPPPW